MFLRFDEVRSSGEKQHDVLLCLCRGVGCGGPLWFVVVDCVRRRREQGGRESKEEVEIFWRSRELSHLPSLFAFVYTPSII
jgi:hypothetical protein